MKANSNDKLKEYRRQYYLQNKEKVLLSQKEYYERNKEHILKRSISYTKKYRKELKPWFVSLDKAKQRCNNPNQHGYKNYGAKGIKCLLSLDDVEFLWKRDNAEAMMRPSLDRLNSDANYVLENCRFLELSENSAKTSHRKTIGQYNINGEFIRSFESSAEAARFLNVKPVSINQAAREPNRTAYGFKWRYHENS